MLRLLQAAVLPKDIVMEGVDIARSCEHCRRYAPRMPKSQVKGHLATNFHEIVQHDLFFLWDEPFMLLIDEAIRWKAGDALPNKQGPTLIRAIMNIWIRLWGPMQYLLSDQEGGLVSDRHPGFATG